MYKRFRIVILNIFVALHVRITFSAELQFDVLKKQRIIEKQSRGIMSPKMDYDEWTPIGRGDPLKNDPTFDYSPPMVGKVKYWINPVHRTPDPPIQLIKEFTSTESSHQYTATVVNSSNFSTAGKPSASSEIKRFYKDSNKEASTGNGTSYVQTANSKYNNKFHRPSSPSQIPQYQNQNHYHHQQLQHYHHHHPTRQPPLPSPMLVPPPPIEPNTYSSSGIQNSTTMELSWDNFKSQSLGLATTESTSYSPPWNVWSSTTSVSTSSPVTKANAASSTDELYLMQHLFDKEESETPITNPTTIAPLTPNPSGFLWKPNSIGLSKTASHLIIQGHSKVKKYGGSGKPSQDKANISSRNNIIDYVDEIIKYELPKETRTGKGLGLEDFLPINGALRETLKDIATNHAEGSGIGADLTKVFFPSYVRPSTTLVYESPRMHHKMRSDDDILQSRSPIYSL